MKQKALPLSPVVRKILELATTEKESVSAWLFIGATFFVMRSCEYRQTNRDENSKRTRIVRLKNSIFKRERVTLEHNSNNLLEVEMVGIKF